MKPKANWTNLNMLIVHCHFKTKLFMVNHSSKIRHLVSNQLHSVFLYLVWGIHCSFLTFSEISCLWGVHKQNPIMHRDAKRAALIYELSSSPNIRTGIDSPQCTIKLMEMRALALDPLRMWVWLDLGSGPVLCAGLESIRCGADWGPGAVGSSMQGRAKGP